eukprot:jgi/Astpho2/767/fgenesh1_pg.00016_%23_19_t
MGQLDLRGIRLPAEGILNRRLAGRKDPTSNQFKEYLEVDNFFDEYLEGLDAPVQDGCGQNKGARAAPVQTPGTQKRKRTRDGRQKLLNKLAQVRYQERKKKKVSSHAATAADLERKVEELKALEAQAQQLEKNNAFLEAAYQQKNREVADLQRAQAAEQHELQALDTLSASRSGSLAGSGQEGTSRLSQAYQEFQDADKKQQLSTLVDNWLFTVEELRRLMSLIGCDGEGEGLGRLLRNATDFSHLSEQQQVVLQQVVVKTDSLVETVMRLCRTLRGWKDEGKWCALARLLDFTPEQQERIFVARSDMLAKLAAVYEARQALNDQARALLQGELGQDQQQRLRGVLRALEENLRQEQRATCEQEFVTFKHLLTPIQGGLFVTQAFPDHCDCLALVNAVHVVYGGPMAMTPTDEIRQNSGILATLTQVQAA